MVMNRKVLFCLILIGCVCGLSFSAMAKDYIYTPINNACQVIDCDTNKVIKSIPYSDYILNSQPSKDGKKLYLNAFHSIYVIDTTKNELVDTFKFSVDLSKVDVLGFDVSEDESTLFLSCNIVKKKQNIPKLDVLPPQMVVYDMKQKQIVKSFEIPPFVTGVTTLRNDPNQLIFVGLDIFKFNLTDGKSEKVMPLLHVAEGQEPKNSLVIWQLRTPGDHGIFVNPYYTPTKMGHYLIDRNTGKVEDLPAKDIWMMYSNILSPDKKYIFGVMDELIKIDAKTGETVKSVKLKNGTSYALSMTSDGKKIYVGPSGADMSVYNTETLELITTIPLEGDGCDAHRISM
jgi:DNA-binding beta-propeller fold protein YncE